MNEMTTTATIQQQKNASSEEAAAAAAAVLVNNNHDGGEARVVSQEEEKDRVDNDNNTSGDRKPPPSHQNGNHDDNSNADKSDNNDNAAVEKKRKRSDEMDTTTTDNNNKDEHDKKRPRLLELAKSRMSKWAARLFDPDRPKGVIEPPQTLPLNDEFLQAFGRREKAHDQAVGKEQMEVDNNLGGEEEEEKEELYADTTEAGEEKKKKGVAVRINNLKYTTSAETLEKACEAFGTLLSVKMLIDESTKSDEKPLNTGRAFVRFDSIDSAQACVDQLDTLDGRPLRVELAADPSNAASASLEASRYFVARDISKKCFRCGQPGHIGEDCQNAPKPKPCPLCADLNHDLRMCPVKAVCFHCGIPGHVARYCTQRSQAPQAPIVCTLCCASGHDKYQCLPDYASAQVAAQHAQCLVCGQMGHLMCQPMKFQGDKDEPSWNRGSDPTMNIYCWNCGERGHVGKQCHRPTADDCNRNEDLAYYEIERAEAEATREYQAPRGREARRDHSQGQQRYDNEHSARQRAKSAPPPPQRDSSRRASSSRYDGPPPQRSTPSPPPPRYTSGGGGGGMPPRHERHQTAPIHKQQQPPPPPTPRGFHNGNPSNSQQQYSQNNKNGNYQNQYPRDNNGNHHLRRQSSDTRRHSSSDLQRQDRRKDPPRRYHSTGGGESGDPRRWQRGGGGGRR